MTRKLDRTQIAGLARIVEPWSVPQVAHPPRTYELPARLYGLTVAAYLAFLAVLGTALMTGGLWIPMAICVAYLAMAFGVPALWAGIAPESGGEALQWDEFRRDGIMTATGRTTAGQATIQVLILPAVVLLWGLAFVTIAALKARLLS